jgi:Carboxypeptidase regulatory-like domain/TonB-dependent Receptor Plug Domain
MALCIAGFAQAVSSSLLGTVTDSSKSVVPNVDVVLTNQETGAVLTAKANTDGLFRFPNLLSGKYSIKVDVAGFAAYTERDIDLSARETRDLGRIELKVKGTTEQVAVTAEVTPLQTGSSEKSALLTGNQLESIAMKGRDFFGMMRLMPGVVDTAGRDVTSNQGTMGGLSYNGTGSGQSNFSLDGVSANDTGSNNDIHFNANMEAISEVRLMPGNYQAEFGRKSGAQIVVITKTGTQQFHGAAYWAHRHEEFNANSFFNNRSGVVKAPYRFNVPGYSIGGPAYIPGVFNKSKNKLFFFFAQEYTRQRVNLSNQYRSMPTDLERKGDFSKSVDTGGKLIVIKDPLTQTAYAGNVIPASLIDPTGQAIINFMPKPNYSDPDPNLVLQRNYLATGSGISPRRNDTLRIDANPSASQRIYWRFIQEPEVLDAPWGGWGSGSSNYLLPTDFRRGRPGRGHVINVTSTLTPTLVNEFVFGKSYSHIYYGLVDESKLSRSNFNNIPQWYKGDVSLASGTSRQGFQPGWSDEDLVPDVAFGSTPVNTPTLNLANTPYENWNDIWTFTDNISKIHGNHNLKAGVYFEHTGKFAVVQYTNDQYRGSFDFGRNTNNPFDTGDGFSNALLGYFNSYAESNRRLTHDSWFTNVETFVQDNWRATRRLTLDIGLRVYFMGSVVDHNNTISAFSPNVYSRSNAPRMYVPGFDGAGKRSALDPVTGKTTYAALIGTYVPGTGSWTNGMEVGGQNGIPSGGWTYKTPLLAPRFGFAWDAFGNGKTAVRGGFGISYDRDGTAGLWEGQGAPPFIADPTTYYGTLSTFGNAAGSIGPTSLTFAGQDMPSPYAMNFSLGVQQSVGFHTVLDVSYVGNQSRHLVYTRQINQLPIFAKFNPANVDPTSATKSPLPDNFLRPYYGWSGIGSYEYGNSSNYNSMQVSARRQMTRGLMFGLSYTWSRYMSYGSPSVYLPLRSRTYGPSGGDRRQMLTINYVYDVPKLSPHFGGKYLAPIVDGWTLSGVTSIATGGPFTPSLGTTAGTDFTGSSEGARINVVGDPYLPKDQRSFGQNFNTAAFAPPTACSWSNQNLACFGNAGTNIMYGPGTNNWDLSILKKVPVHMGEGRSLEFRAEAYNAPNHTQFSGYDTSTRFDPTGKQTNANFGAFSSARSPRIMAFTVRLQF